MYSTAVQKAFGESDSELCDYIIITADQGNSGVKVKMPWLYLMHQDKSDSKVETLKCLKHPKPHQTFLLQISSIFILKWSNSQAKLILDQNSFLVMSMELP